MRLWGRKKPEAVVSPEVLQERQKTEQALRALDELRAQTPRIVALSDQMVQLRVRNHFGESLTLAMMPKEKK